MTILKAIKFSNRPRRVPVAEFYSTIDRGGQLDFQEIKRDERWYVQRDGHEHGKLTSAANDLLLDNVLQFVTPDE